MNDLLTAAKAVIDHWQRRGVFHVTKDQLDTLRDAVERAEQQEAVGFEEWWDEHVGYGEPHRLANDRRVWTAAQQAERERIKKIITYQFGDLVSDLSEVMEMIDE